MRDIKYKSISCGPAGSFQPGDTRYGVPDDEAQALVAGRYAEYVGQPTPPVREQAVVAPVEHAVLQHTQRPPRPIPTPPPRPRS